MLPNILKKKNISSLEWLAQDYEIRMSKRLERTRIVATISPMVGLMGTLIPQGPALIGLSRGYRATRKQFDDSFCYNGHWIVRRKYRVRADTGKKKMVLAGHVRY
ncbi:hypothetical protein [uncultured Methanolobus sp.]|uniref:hypothetical protein n=1 Tax=uncultured Methanolobus sp. TaxID=218300 RepID=UPI0029C7D3AF|nr:hypothetical protein [uncultured Methanolobus sp.]